MATKTMPTITKADVATWAQHNDTLTGLFAELEEVGDKLTRLITLINEEIEEAASFVQGIADEAEVEFEERSERWQESEAGEEYKGWYEMVAELAGQIEPLDEIEIPGCPDWVGEDLPEQA
jgi:hypothetical protein